MYTTIILATMLSVGAPGRFQARRMARPQGITYSAVQPQVMYAAPGVQGQAVQVASGSLPGFVPGSALPPGAIIIISGASPMTQPIMAAPIQGAAPMYQPGFAPAYYGGFSGGFSRGGCSSCR